MAMQFVSGHCGKRRPLALDNGLRDEAIRSSPRTREGWTASSLRLSKPRNMLLAMAIVSASSGIALSQTLPDGESGRYTMTVVPDGLMRLDTRTGAVSTCTNKENGWACYAIPDERAALDTEIGRLQTENAGLRAQLAARSPLAENKIDEALPKSDPLVPPIPKSADGERKIEIPLPSGKDMDRVMGFLESAWKRLVDMAARIQRDTTGKI